MKAIYSLLLAFVATVTFSSCGDDDEFIPEGDHLTMELSRQVIQANGQDETEFIVRLDGRQITEGVKIYDQDDQPIEGTKFSTSEPGQYSFWASYKTLNTNDKPVVVKAISVAVPELPADPRPGHAVFAKKVMLSQFTGTRCPNCPRMTSVVRQVMEDQTIKDKVVFTSPHTFNSSDPGYIDVPLAQAFQVSSYPCMVFDLTMSTTYTFSFTKDWLTKTINDCYALPAKAGIAVKSELIDGANGEKQIAIHVAVKAQEEGNYRVGAWLLEDGIHAKQQNVGVPGDYDTHNNVVRVADSKGMGSSYSGVDLGTIEAKKTAEHVFVMNLNPKWELKNCHIAIFVTSKNDKGMLPVVNVIDCPVECSLPFNYAD